MQIIRSHELPSRLEPLLDAVESGEEVIITRNGRAVARIVRNEPEPMGTRFPDRSAFRRTISSGSVSAADTMRGMRDEERF